MISKYTLVIYLSLLVAFWITPDVDSAGKDKAADAAPSVTKPTPRPPKSELRARLTTLARSAGGGRRTTPRRNRTQFRHNKFQTTAKARPLQMSTVPVIIAPTVKHTASIIFLHGLGDTGHGWANAIAAVGLPHVKVICPTANPLSVTLNAGMKMPAWFDIKGLDSFAIEDEAGINRATMYVHSLINKEVKDGISSERIILGGFSQGGALALQSALTFPQKLAGVVALSCWLPLHKTFSPSQVTANKDIHILQCHGDCDPIVSLNFGHQTASILKTVSNNTDFKTYIGVMHNSNEEEMEDVRNFIKARIPAI